MVNNKQGLIDYTKRALGWPVITLELDDDQISDRLDDAIQFYQAYSHSGTELTLAKHQITSGDKANGWIQMDSSVAGVNRIFPVSTVSMGVGDWNIQYQFMMNNVFTWASAQGAQFLDYTMLKTHLSMVEFLLSGQKPIRFNVNTEKLYLDMDWTAVPVDSWIIIECYVVVDPEQYTKMYNDQYFKRLCVGYVKKQWGYNLKKYNGVALVGGIELNGQKIYDEAMQEIEIVEKDIQTILQAPPMMTIG